jgi:DNA-binding MarR family transcriptional regulator
MQPYPGLLIAAARRAIKQAVLARISGRQLTAQQFWLLVAVDENPGISQAEIAARVRADPPAVSRALAALAERGVVRSTPDPDDRRRTCVHLTPAGKRVARELAPLAREIREAIVAGMSPDEIAALTAALQRVVTNLDGLERRAGARERATSSQS